MNTALLPRPHLPLNSVARWHIGQTFSEALMFAPQFGHLRRSARAHDAHPEPSPGNFEPHLMQKLSLSVLDGTIGTGTLSSLTVLVAGGFSFNDRHFMHPEPSSGNLDPHLVQKLSFLTTTPTTVFSVFFTCSDGSILLTFIISRICAISTFVSSTSPANVRISSCISLMRCGSCVLSTFLPPNRSMSSFPNSSRTVSTCGPGDLRFHGHANSGSNHLTHYLLTSEVPLGRANPLRGSAWWDN